MGMFDSINGEQVKVFTYPYVWNDELSYSGGSVKNYNNGDPVPYKTWYYNYGKDFIILDINTECDYFNEYRFIAHIVQDGKVKATFKDTVPNKYFDKIRRVVNAFFGDEMNIHSRADIEQYILDSQEYEKKSDIINVNWNALFKEFSRVIHGIGTLDQESDEYKTRRARMTELKALMAKDREKNKDALQSLYDTYMKQWEVLTAPPIERLQSFGAYLTVYKRNSEQIEMAKKDNGQDNISEYIKKFKQKAAFCRKQIAKALENETLLSDFIQWQEIDFEEQEEIKDFIVRCMTENAGSE